MKKNNKKKPAYETPKIIPLGELIKSAGGLTSCKSGTNAKNVCTTGGAPRRPTP
jgi:hypothetical protein